MKKLNLVIDSTNWLEATWTEEITTEVQVEKEGETVTEEKTETKVLHCESFGDIPEYQELFKTRCKELGFELQKEHLNVLKKQAKNRVLPTDEEKEKVLKEAKQSKIQEMNGICSATITSGFISDALGSEHIYPSEEVDQLNLIGMILDGEDDLFKCKENKAESINEYKLHTIEQLNKVLRDGKEFKKLQLFKYAELKSQINSCSSIEEVNNISW